MADGDYRRLAAACACGEPVKEWFGRGRPPKFCAGCTPKPKPIVRTSKACEQCGTAMPPATAKMQKRFCSVACNALSQRKSPDVRCRACGVQFWRRLGGTDIRLGMDRPIFCSYKCAHADRSAAAASRKQERDRLAAIKKLARKIAQLAKHKEPKDRSCVCAMCGVLYEHTKHRRKDRCPKCSAAVYADLRRAHAAKSRKTAAGRASKAAYKARRRARERSIRTEPVDPLTILARDRWTCRLCGRKTPKNKRGTYDDDAPELDHIVSLAEGGPHVAENLQCACRRCNILKGANSMGQLHLAV